MKIVIAIAALAVSVGCAHREATPGAETCTPADTIACAVQCDEGEAGACRQLTTWAPHLLDAQGHIARTTLQGACAAGHPQACAREALHLFNAGNAADAYALVEPMCTDREWYACDVAAEIADAVPLPPRGDFKPHKARGASRCAGSSGRQRSTRAAQPSMAWPGTAFDLLLIKTPM